MNRMIYAVRSALLLIVTPCALCATTDVYWSNADGGALFDKVNYEGGADPTVADARLCFRSAVSGDITLPVSVSGAPNGFRIGYDGCENLDIPFAFADDAVFGLKGVLYIYKKNTLTLKSGTIEASNDTQAIGVSGGAAALVLVGPNAVYRNVGGKSLYLGHHENEASTDCRIDISGGARMQSDIIVGRGSGGHSILVSGIGSKLVGSVKIGSADANGNAGFASCNNCIRIEDGAVFEGDVKVRKTGSLHNRIELVGVGSAWTRANEVLQIDSAADSAVQSMLIADGAEFATLSDIYVGDVTSSNVLRVTGGILYAESLDIGYSGEFSAGNQMEITEGSRVALSRIRMRTGPESYLNIENSKVSIKDLIVSHEKSYNSASNCVMRLAGTNTEVSVDNKFLLSGSATLNVEVSYPNEVAMLTAGLFEFVQGATVNIEAASVCAYRKFEGGRICTVFKSSKGAGIDFSSLTLNLAENVRRVNFADTSCLQVKVFKKGFSVIIQ